MLENFKVQRRIPGGFVYEYLSSHPELGDAEDWTADGRAAALFSCAVAADLAHRLGAMDVKTGAPEPVKRERKRRQRAREATTEQSFRVSPQQTFADLEKRGLA